MIVKVINNTIRVKMLSQETSSKLQKGQQTLSDIRYHNQMMSELNRPEEVIMPTRKTNESDTTRYKQSLYRTKRYILDTLEANINETSYFITLTYVGNFQDYDGARIDFQNFVRTMKRILGSFEYIGAKEHQGRGAIHFHLITFQPISEMIVSHGWPHGFLNVKHIDDISDIKRIATYFVSYLTRMKKNNPQVANNKKLVFTSKGLNKPYNVSKGVLLDMVRSYLEENSHSLEPSKTYRSKYFGWVNEYELDINIILQLNGLV